MFKKTLFAGLLALIPFTAFASSFPPLEPVSYPYVNITTETTTTPFTGAGTLRTICINKPVASETIKVYDAATATGDVVATITLPATLLTDGPHCADYNAALKTGLTIVTTGAGADITVSFQH